MERNLENRAKGLRNALVALFEAGYAMPSPTKGYEREQFVHYFLADVFPPGFRFGTGIIVDRKGHKSRQIDVVVEFPFFPSLPVGGGRSSRLYLAEGVAAAIEIKSNLLGQWKEVRSNAASLSRVKRDFTELDKRKRKALARIPYFAVGFQGWKRKTKVREHVDASSVDGILVLDPGIFVSKPGLYSHDPGRRAFTKLPPSALVAFLGCLHRAVTAIEMTDTKLDSYIDWVPAK